MENFDVIRELETAQLRGTVIEGFGDGIECKDGRSTELIAKYKGVCVHLQEQGRRFDLIGQSVRFIIEGVDVISGAVVGALIHENKP